MGGLHSKSGRFWIREKNPTLTGIRTPDRPARSLVALPTTLLQLSRVVTIRGIKLFEEILSLFSSPTAVWMSRWTERKRPIRREDNIKSRSEIRGCELVSSGPGLGPLQDLAKFFFNFRCHERQEIFWSVEQLIVSEGLCFTVCRYEANRRGRNLHN